MRSHHAFEMPYDRILSPMLAICLSLVPMHNCMAELNDAIHQNAKAAQDQSASRLTRLDLSRITFDDDISYLSAAEQERYRNCQSDFFKYLKQLPSKQRKELQETYKWVPDVVKVIASRDYQDRKEYIKQFKPKAELYDKVTLELWKRRKQIPRCIEMYHAIRACEEMIQYRYPSQMIDPQKQDIEAAAKQCGFGYLSKMVDFCNDPKNHGKIYQKSVDKFTSDKTLEEMKAFKSIGLKYEKEIWEDFQKQTWAYNYKFWRFNLKNMDTSNLTPDEYAKMERQLKCIPPAILINCRFRTYDSRNSDESKLGKKCIRIMNDPTYIGGYAKWKGINLSEDEVKEVYKLASELLKYGTPLKLVKRDERTELGTIAENFGIYRVNSFYLYCKAKMKSRDKTKFKFYGSHPENIPKFIKQAQDFYDLGMAVNLEGTKELYHNIEVDTGIVIQPPQYQ